MIFLAITQVAAPAFARRQVELPLDIGVGPAAHLITGPMFADKPIHTGLRLSTYFVIDRKTRQRYRNRIPAKYRKMLDGQGDIKFNPLSCCIPSTLYISPPIKNSIFADTGIYGLTMKPIGLGLNLFGDSTASFGVSVGALLTYFFMHSKTLESPMHFLRPGLEAKAEFEMNFGSVGASIGWASMFHIPQPVGGSILEIGPLDEAVWHIGQAFIQFHFRTPVSVSL